MKFCENCGTQLNDNVKFCSKCGTLQAVQQMNQMPGSVNQQVYVGQPQMNQMQNQQVYNGQVPQARSQVNQQAYGNYNQSSEVQEGKVFAILSYFSWLVLIPIFAAKNNKYARFHANQGLLLMIAEFAYAVFYGIALVVLGTIFPYKWTGYLMYSRGPIYGIIFGLLSLVFIVFTVFAIIGIINAASGKMKELPIIGRFRLLK